MRTSRRVTGAPARRRPGRPPGPSQRQQVHDGLVAEASRLYAGGGNAGLSYGLLAERCGITKATVFHYFPSKEALVYAVFDSMGRRLEAAARDWFEAPSESYGDRLDHLVGSIVEFYGDDPVNARILCQGLLNTNSGAPPPGIFAEFVQRFTEFIQAGIDSGEFFPAAPLATVLSIGGAILFEFMLPPVSRPILQGADGKEARAARRRAVAEFVRRAVVRPRAPARAPRRGSES